MEDVEKYMSDASALHIVHLTQGFSHSLAGITDVVRSLHMKRDGGIHSLCFVYKM